jgi:hypothetical protein
LILIGLFCLSRYLYAWAGIRFAGDTFLLGWQFIDLELLKNDLWRSLFYLHSQPPLLNLFTGLTLQLFPENYSKVFQLVFAVGGLVLSLSVYSLGSHLGFPKWLAVVVAAWFSLSPATVVYENWLSYAYPLAVALVVAGVFLARFVDDRRPIDGLVFSLALATMALTWGLFHLLWLLGCFGIAAFASWKRPGKLLWLLPALLLVTGWYAKNGILYGTFTASSWAGMNLSKIVTLHISGDTRVAWAKQGLISDLALLPPFRSREVYLRYYPDTPQTGIPLLDQESYESGFPNYHSLVHIEASRQQMRDAIRMIRLAPRHYGLNVLRAIYIFFHSASDYEHVFEIRQPIDELDTVWNRAFYWQWQKGETFPELGSSFSLDHVAWGWILAYGVAVCGAVVYLWRMRVELETKEAALLLFLLWNILFVSAAGILLDIGENNRFRFVIDPVVTLLFVYMLRKTLRSWNRKKKTPAP